MFEWLEVVFVSLCIVVHTLPILASPLTLSALLARFISIESYDMQEYKCTQASYMIAA
jgi:hypothetical protein